MQKIVIEISADAEWRVLCDQYPNAFMQNTPYGEYFLTEVAGQEVLFFHGGWGKIAAASSTAYAIGRWQPELLINLGTCGGFEGLAAKGEIILAEKTIVYDIVEQMGDADEAIADYTTVLDTVWAGEQLPTGVRRGLLLSADKDIITTELPHLRDHFQGVAADWESGAIAWVAARHQTPTLILRGVSDVVSETHAEAAGSIEVFEAGTRQVIQALLAQLPFWLTKWQDHHS